MKFEIEVTDNVLEVIKKYIQHEILLDKVKDKDKLDEGLIKFLFFIPEVDPNFEIEDQVKVRKIEDGKI